MLTSQTNLFHWATSELSQDAFLCWLLQWARPEHAEVADLHQASKRFLTLLLAACPDIPDASSCVLREVYRQISDIDILLKLSINDETYGLIIEDKVEATTYNDLDRYREKARQIGGFAQAKISGVVVKTGAQSSFHRVIEKGFGVFKRIDMVNFLQEDVSQQVTHDVFRQFREHILCLHEVYRAYQKQPIGEWRKHHRAWQGLYEQLQETTRFKAWRYVANASGGFWASLWPYTQMIKYNELVLYLQIEQSDLCFKVGNVKMEGAYRREVRTRFHRQIMEQARAESKPEITRPKAFGNGRYMTLAVVQREHWLGAPQEVVMLAGVKDRLREYGQFLERCLEES